MSTTPCGEIPLYEKHEEYEDDEDDFDEEYDDDFDEEEWDDEDGQPFNGRDGDCYYIHGVNYRHTAITESMFSTLVEEALKNSLIGTVSWRERSHVHRLLFRPELTAKTPKRDDCPLCNPKRGDTHRVVRNEMIARHLENVLGIDIYGNRVD